MIKFGKIFRLIRILIRRYQFCNGLMKCSLVKDIWGGYLIADIFMTLPKTYCEFHGHYIYCNIQWMINSYSIKYYLDSPKNKNGYGSILVLQFIGLWLHILVFWMSFWILFFIKKGRFTTNHDIFVLGYVSIGLVE